MVARSETSIVGASRLDNLETKQVTKTDLPLLDERKARRVIDLGDRHRWVEVSDRVSYIAYDLKKPGKGGRMSRIKTMYVGFATYAEALRYAKASRKRCQVREAFRTGIDYLYEVKVQGDIELLEIEAIASNLDKFFPVDFNRSGEEDDNRGSGRRLPVKPKCRHSRTLQDRRKAALFC